MRHVPLRYRLPNAPADFVGRERELGEVAEALREAHVTVVTGPGGVGKTALSLQTLHRRFPKRVGRCLFVSLASCGDALEARAEVLRALASAEGEEVDWAELTDDPDALTEALLDLAEKEKWWIVLDGPGHLPIEEEAEFLTSLSRYARQSRYLITTRNAPTTLPGSSMRTIDLGALCDGALEKLAVRWARDLPREAQSRAIEASGGSPWLLREALRHAEIGTPVSSEPTREALLEGLGDSARKFALTAAWIEVPVPPDELARATGVTVENFWGALHARGWLDESPAGVRLNDVTRQALTRGGTDRPPGEAWTLAAAALTESPSTPIRLEGVRLLLEAGELDRAEAVLNANLDHVLSEGYAVSLWRLLGRVPADRLTGVRLRCAAELGNPTVLRQVHRPERGTPGDRLKYAETLYMRGHLEAALDTIQEAEGAVPSNDPAQTDRALLKSRILFAMDARAEAADVLAPLVPQSEEQRVMRELMLVLSGIESERQATLRLRALEPAISELPSLAEARAQFLLALAYFRSSSLDSAARVLSARRADGVHDALDLFESRQALELEAAVDLARGHLGTAAAKLDQLAPYLHSASLIRPEYSLTRVRLAMARGNMADLIRNLDAAVEEAASLGIKLSVRHGRALRARAEELLLTGDGAERRRAITRVWLDDLERFMAESRDALSLANASGHAVRAAEARAELCAALLLLGRRGELAEAVEALGESASEMGSARFENQAALLGMVTGPDWAVLERLAARSDENPVAARRARLLLGSDTEPHDLLDEALVKALEQNPNWGQPRVFVHAKLDGTWKKGWGIAPAEQRVWLSSGAWVDLARRPLQLKLLTTLARRGGSATKEDLVREVWEESDYHPLRHDSRLQVTIRKLREVLETDASEPRYLVTTPEGYALRGPVRIVEPRTP